jgi:protein-glutamine gamma-glutamyltransferase
MSAVAAPRATAAVAPPTEWQLAGWAVRLATFAALAGFATGHWARLVEDPPASGLAGAVLAAVAIASGLTALGRLDMPRGAVHVAAGAVTLFGLCLALVAAGLSGSLLEPARWDDLANEIDRGLAGIRNVSWPYSGPDESVRLSILLGAPVLLSLAAALAFWPVRRGASALRALALVALLVLYGLSVTEYDPGRPLLRGAALLALVAAWLWLPRLGRREAVPALIAVLAVGALSLPLAARLDSEGALIDYRAWDWFGGKDVTFNWNHSYGPLEWPRDGTTLLNVRAGRAHYWKAETLDHFDGLRWVRSRDNEGTGPLAELPSRPDRRWDERIRVTVRALRTDFIVATGTPYLVMGAGESVSGSADGTIRRLEEPLRRGDSYSVRTYAPNPSVREMRRATEPYGGSLAQYTTLALPPRGVDALKQAPPSSSGPPRFTPSAEQVEMPLRRGSDAVPAAAVRLEDSPYRRTFDLARRLALGAPTAYDAARRIERHLERNYTYSERPPSRPYPLESFLFQDRIGYCQQFSGAMALMLRMVGIPARVVSGFSPGSFNRDTHEYRVRDLDAHSWVEVYFSGIGWVTFDPTPAAAPADRPGGQSDSSRSSEDSAANITGDSTGAPGGDRPSRAQAGERDGDRGGRRGWVVGLGLVSLALAALGSALAVRRRRRPSPAAAAEATLRELQRALPRLGWELGAGTTLLELERRLGRAAGPRAAAYVARLRLGRFGARDVAPPDPGERRALRRELTANRGLRARLRGYLALPPIPFTGS